MNVFEPVQVNLVKSFRNKCKLAVLDRLDRRLSHLLHSDEPLLLDHRLYRCVAAVMGTDSMGMRNDLDKETKLLKIPNDLLTGVIAVHSRVLSAEIVHGSVIVQNIDLLQLVTLSDLKVVRVMCRRNLYAACSEFHVDIFIGDYRNLTVCERQDQHLADDVLISFIIRIHGDSCIAEHGLRSCGGDLNKSAFLADYRIIDMPEETVLVFVLDLCIGNRCLADRAPVDDLGSLINVALIVEALENFQNRVGTAFIHCEALSVPVSGTAKLLKLADDSCSVLFSPGPTMLQEFFSSDFILFDSLAAQMIDDLDFRCDCSVIGSGLPESLIALHSLPTDQNILHRVVKRMAHMQLAGNVWRRHDDRERLLIRIHFGVEVTAIQPLLVQPVFQALRVVSLSEFLFHNLLQRSL